MTHRPLIVLADPEWIGHRETYFREFVLSLHRVGADVIALCPNPTKLTSLGLDPSRLYGELLTEPQRLPLLRRLFQDPVNTHLRWRYLKRALHKAEAKVGRPADFLFLPWLDCYLRVSLSQKLASAQVDTPWAGLYFRPNHLVDEQLKIRTTTFFQAAAKGDGLLRSSNCRAVAILDETMRPALETTTRKPVILFPDITDESAPDPETPFARQIRERANGRKVIGLIGMEPRKGVTTMLKAADVAREKRLPWLFVLAGTSCLPQYSPSERRFIEEHIAQSRDASSNSNVLFPDEFKPIPDGPAFNGVMDAFDVLFIAYHDFLGSSNVLTKSSILKKPVVSTELGCIAHRTKVHQLGLTIPQGDAEACCKAIEKLLQGVDWNEKPLHPQHGEYHSEHSRDALDRSMQRLIDLI